VSSGAAAAGRAQAATSTIVAVTANADELLARARARLSRLSPAEAWAAAAGGAALIVDIRSDAARRRDGVVPGSVHIPRTVLEWRLDPSSEWRDTAVAGCGRRIVLICDQGWSSSLAAAAVQELGHSDATDVDGGIAAWREAGLPLEPPED
jgi:rhodanese-related sulfurtransferase